MRISEKKKQEIVAVFQRSFKRDNSDEIAAIPLVELRQADEMLGDRDLNSGFRLAMRNRISELESVEAMKDQRIYDSRIRAWNLVSGVFIGLAIAGLAKLLFA